MQQKKEEKKKEKAVSSAHQKLYPPQRTDQHNPIGKGREKSNEERVW